MGGPRLESRTRDSSFLQNVHTGSPIRWLPGLSPRRKVNHSSHSSDLKNEWRYTPSWRGQGKTSLLAFYHPRYLNIPFNIIIPSARAFWKLFFCYKFYHLYSVSIYFLPHTCHMPSAIIAFDVVTRMILLTKSPVQAKR